MLPGCRGLSDETCRACGASLQQQDRESSWSWLVVLLGFVCSIIVAPLLQHVSSILRGHKEAVLRALWTKCESDMVAYLERCCVWAESNPQVPLVEPFWDAKSAHDLLKDASLILTAEEHEQGLLLLEIVDIARAFCCCLGNAPRECDVSIPPMLKGHPIVKRLVASLQLRWDERMRNLEEAFNSPNPNVSALRNLVEDAQQVCHRFSAFLPDLTVDDYWNRCQQLEQVPLRLGPSPLLLGGLSEQGILLQGSVQDDVSTDAEIVHSASSLPGQTTELVTAVREQTSVQLWDLQFKSHKFALERQERRQDRARKEAFQREQDRLKAQEKDDRLKAKLGAAKELHAEKQLQRVISVGLSCE